MSTLELIVSDLKTLPPPKLEEAAALIHHLKESIHAERVEALRRTAGVWSGPRGAAIEKAIADGCDDPPQAADTAQKYTRPASYSGDCMSAKVGDAGKATPGASFRARLTAAE